MFDTNWWLDSFGENCAYESQMYSYEMLAPASSFPSPEDCGMPKKDLGLAWLFANEAHYAQVESHRRA